MIEGDTGLLSDDRVAVRKIGGEFSVFGTPWSGEADIAENRCLPLRGIFFLSQSAENTIKELPHAEAMARLVSLTSVPWYDEIAMTKVLHFCSDLVYAVPAYELYFRPGEEVIDVFKRFVS